MKVYVLTGCFDSERNEDTLRPVENTIIAIYDSQEKAENALTEEEKCRPRKFDYFEVEEFELQ